MMIITKLMMEIVLLVFGVNWFTDCYSRENEVIIIMDMMSLKIASTASIGNNDSNWYNKTIICSISIKLNCSESFGNKHLLWNFMGIMKNVVVLLFDRKYNYSYVMEDVLLIFDGNYIIYIWYY